MTLTSAGHQLFLCTNKISCCLCQCSHSHLDSLLIVYEAQG